METQQQQQQAAAALKSRFKRVCVFCGSSPGKSPSYQLAAIQLGKQLVIHPLSAFVIHLSFWNPSFSVLRLHN